MRNVFDQYTQPENRLTHALITTLSEDRDLIRPFLAWLGEKGVPPAKRIALVEQQMPGEFVSGDEDEKRGLPDASLFDPRGSWCCLIESKVQAMPSLDQLRRHRQTARRQGFAEPSVVLLAVEPPKWKVPAWVEFRAWRELYRWFGGRQERSAWARRLVQYMEVFEARAVERGYGIEGTITMFDGIRFDDDNPYSYPEARRLIRLLRDELTGVNRLRDIGADLGGRRRGAITGRRGDAVWDYIPLVEAAHADAHTQYPHLTLGIHAAGTVDATVTIPDGTRGGLRTRLRALGQERFVELLCHIHGRLVPVYGRSRGARPLIYATQRHWPVRGAAPIEDARLACDLRTLPDGSAGGVKAQPEWVAALWSVLANKRSNIQFGLSVEYRTTCPVVRSRKLVKLLADTWIAASPLLDFVMGRSGE